MECKCCSKEFLPKSKVQVFCQPNCLDNFYYRRRIRRIENKNIKDATTREDYINFIKKCLNTFKVGLELKYRTKEEGKQSGNIVQVTKHHIIVKNGTRIDCVMLNDIYTKKIKVQILRECVA